MRCLILLFVGVTAVAVADDRMQSRVGKLREERRSRLLDKLVGLTRRSLRSKGSVRIRPSSSGSTGTSTQAMILFAKCAGSGGVLGRLR